MRVRALVMTALLTAPVGIVFAGEALKLDTETDRINYSIGYQIGGDFKRQGVELNPDAIVRGIQDALSGDVPLMAHKDMQTALVELKRKIVADQRQQKRQLAEKYRAQGQEFLVDNAKKEGVKTTASGLQYKVIKEGTGKSPGPTDSVLVHYRGTLIDGTEFDSSLRDNKPATFRVDGVIRGWTEALQLMKEGAKWQLFLPPDLAYGDRGPLADRTLIFDVELTSIR